MENRALVQALVKQKSNLTIVPTMQSEGLKVHADKLQEIPIETFLMIWMMAVESMTEQITENLILLADDFETAHPAMFYLAKFEIERQFSDAARV